MNKRAILLGMALIPVILFGGIPEGRAAPMEQPKAAQPVKSPAPSRWDTALQAARGEGTLIVYTSANPAARQALAKEFKEKYGIAVDFIAGRGEELENRITTENRAGLYLGDLVLVGAPLLMQNLKPAGYLAVLDSTLILPEVADPARWRGKKLPFLDRDHQAIAFVSQTASHVAVNLDAVKPGEIKSYRDLLDPKRKGKIVMDDPTVTGNANHWSQFMLVLFGFEKGKEYLQQIARQEPVVLRDKRLVIEWLARNKYPVAIGPDWQTYSEFKAKGAPIACLKHSEASGITAGGGCLAMLKRAAHPNASLVFINWLLTREGQTIFKKAYGTPSARLDVDTTGIDPAFIPQEGERLISTNGDEWWPGTNDRIEIIKQIFKPLMQ